MYKRGWERKYEGRRGAHGGTRGIEGGGEVRGRTEMEI